MKPLALALALALALPGCAFLRGEGEESLRVANEDVQPVNVIVQITQRDGEERVFGESIRLGPGEATDRVLVMAAGEHSVLVTTSTSIQELIVIDIPTRGDTVIDITLRRGSATVSTKSA